MFLSIFSGVFWTSTFFMLCLIIVVGIKTVYYTIKAKFSKKQPPKEEKHIEVKRRKPRTVRTIEIDPELADRIYFKKSS